VLSDADVHLLRALNERSNCQLFVECLTQGRAWSQAQSRLFHFLADREKSGGVATIPNS
jgi:hypothetical protein